MKNAVVALIAVSLLIGGTAAANTRVVDRDHLPEDCGHYLETERAARERGVGLWADYSPSFLLSTVMKS